MRRVGGFAGHAQSFGFRFDPTLEGDAVIGRERFDSCQFFEEIEVPHGAAELAVGRALKAYRRLLVDRVQDDAVFHFAQLLRVDFASFAEGPGVL